MTHHVGRCSQCTQQVEFWSVSDHDLVCVECQFFKARKSSESQPSFSGLKFWDKFPEEPRGSIRIIRKNGKDKQVIERQVFAPFAEKWKGAFWTPDWIWSRDPEGHLQQHARVLSVSPEGAGKWAAL